MQSWILKVVFYSELAVLTSGLRLEKNCISRQWIQGELQGKAVDQPPVLSLHPLNIQAEFGVCQCQPWTPPRPLDLGPGSSAEKNNPLQCAHAKLRTASMCKFLPATWYTNVPLQHGLLKFPYPPLLFCHLNLSSCLSVLLFTPKPQPRIHVSLILHRGDMVGTPPPSPGHLQIHLSLHLCPRKRHLSS